MQLLQVADGRVDATVLLGDLDETPELLLDIGGVTAPQAFTVDDTEPPRLPNSIAKVGETNASVGCARTGMSNL